MWSQTYSPYRFPSHGHRFCGPSTEDTTSPGKDPRGNPGDHKQTGWSIQQSRILGGHLRISTGLDKLLPAYNLLFYYMDLGYSKRWIEVKCQRQLSDFDLI